MGRSMASRVRTCRRSGQVSITDLRSSFRRHTVLHDITDDAELVEVTAAALGAEGLLECDLARCDKQLKRCKDGR